MDRRIAGRSTRAPCRSVALLAALAIAGCAGSRPPSEDLTVLEGQGRSLFVDHCALCHGDDARGTGDLPGTWTPAADLTHIAARRGGRFPHAEIARLIDGRMPVDAHRSEEMPIWGRVWSAEIGDPEIGEEVTRGRVSALIVYLESIQVE